MFMRFKIISVLSLLQFCIPVVIAAPTVNEEWLVIVKEGNMTTFNNSVNAVNSASALSLKREIKDDNPHSFNAMLVHGDGQELRKRFHSDQYIVVRNEKVSYCGGRSRDDNEKKIGSEQNWGLNKVSRRTGNYIFPSNGGANSIVYVVDSGIDYQHASFGGRVKLGKTFGNNVSFDGMDREGHGTHVAGIIGSDDHGVAPKTTIINVAVSQIDGQFMLSSDLAEALQFVLADYQTHKKPSVVNLSWSGGSNQAFSFIIEQLYRVGLHVVAAAGNQNSNACLLSPSNSPYALSVAASNINDELTSFSNTGPCVDMIAPGENIVNLAPGNRLQMLSGTSMAAPFVSGVLALILSERTFVSVDEAFNYVKDISIKQEIKNVPDNTVNSILFNGISPSCSNEGSCALA